MPHSHDYGAAQESLSRVGSLTASQQYFPSKKKKKGCRKFIKNLDIFAKPIQLTFRGKDKFQSFMGGFLSLLVFLFIFSIFIYKLRDMILRNQAQIKKNTLVSISNSWTPPEDISSKNISFAFKLSDFYGNNIQDNPKHGVLKLRQFDIRMITNPVDGTTSRTFANYQIPISTCKIGKNFFYENSGELDLYSIENYYCPDWNNLTLQGNWYAPEYKGLTLIFQRCLGSNCSTDAEFKDWFAPILVQEIFTTSYFNIGDYEKPIHYFLDNIWVNLQYGRSVVYQTFMKKNQIQLSDNLFGLFYTTVNDYFYEISKNTYFTADDKKGPGEGVLFSQDIIIDKEYDIFNRQVYTLTGVLQDIGGFYNSCLFACLLIYSRFQGTLYFSSLISKLYQVDVKPSKSKKGRRIYDLEGAEQDSTISNMKLGKSGSQKKFSSQAVQKVISENKGNITEDFLSFMMGQLDSRWRLRVQCKDVCRSFFYKYFCLSFCKSRTMKKNKKKILLYKKGEEKIKRELDAVNLLTKMRQLNTFFSFFFNNRQKFLMMFSKKNLLNYSDSSQSEEEGPRVQRFIKKYKENSDFDSDDGQPRYRPVVYAKQMHDALKHFMDPSQVSQIDKRLLFGLVSKNPSKLMTNEPTHISSTEKLNSKRKNKIKVASDDLVDYQSSAEIINQNKSYQINGLDKTQQEFFTQGTIGVQNSQQRANNNDKPIRESLRKMLQKKPKKGESSATMSKFKNKSRTAGGFNDHHDKFTHTINPQQKSGQSKKRKNEKKPQYSSEEEDDNKLGKIFRN
eukprot:403339471